jgi:hypothetical protein
LYRANFGQATSSTFGHYKRAETGKEYGGYFGPYSYNRFLGTNSPNLSKYQIITFHKNLIKYGLQFVLEPTNVTQFTMSEGFELVYHDNADRVYFVSKN